MLIQFRNPERNGRLLGLRDALLSVALGSVLVLGGCNVRDNIGDTPDTSVYGAERNAAEKKLIAANAHELFDDGYSWVGGNPEGDITLVKFFDYRCPVCRRAAHEVASLVAKDGNIRMIIKEFPIVGADSRMAAHFAIATRLVAGDDAYKQVHDTLFNFNGKVSEVTLRRISDGLELDSDAILAAMSSDKVSVEIARNRSLARKMRITGTPSFVVGTEILRGFRSANQLRKIVNRVRAEQG